MKRLNSVLLHLDLLNCHHVGRVLLAGNLYCILLPQDEFGSCDPYAIFASLYISTSAGYEQLVFHQQSYEGCINVTVDWPHHAAAADFSLGQCNSIYFRVGCYRMDTDCHWGIKVEPEMPPCTYSGSGIMVVSDPDQSGSPAIPPLDNSSSSSDSTSPTTTSDNSGSSSTPSDATSSADANPAGSSASSAPSDSANPSSSNNSGLSLIPEPASTANDTDTAACPGCTSAVAPGRWSGSNYEVALAHTTHVKYTVLFNHSVRAAVRVAEVAQAHHLSVAKMKPAYLSSHCLCSAERFRLLPTPVHPDVSLVFRTASFMWIA